MFNFLLLSQFLIFFVCGYGHGKSNNQKNTIVLYVVMFGDRKNQHILKGGMDLFSQNKTKISKIKINKCLVMGA